MIKLTSELTKEGVVYSHPVLGKVATVLREGPQWYVRPYSFPPYEYGRSFVSFMAAEAYATVIALEQHEVKR